MSLPIRATTPADALAPRWKHGPERWLGAITVLVVVFLVIPILAILPASFNAGAQLAVPPHGFSLEWYAKAVQEPGFRDAFLTSVEVALIATTLSVILGTCTSYALARSRLRFALTLNAFFLSPLIVPTVAYGAGMLFFLAPLDLTPTVFGLVLAHTVITLPYTIRATTATLQSVDTVTEDAAAILGADPIKTFWYVLLPQLRPGLIAGATFSLMISFDEFSASLFLTGIGAMTLPLQIYNAAEFVINPTLAAVSVFLVIMSTLGIVLIDRFIGLAEHFRL